MRRHGRGDTAPAVGASSGVGAGCRSALRPEGPLGILDDDEPVHEALLGRACDFRDVAPVVAVEIDEHGLGERFIGTEYAPAGE
jgi:hypothetical protein